MRNRHSGRVLGGSGNQIDSGTGCVGAGDDDLKSVPQALKQVLDVKISKLLRVNT